MKTIFSDDLASIHRYFYGKEKFKDKTVCITGCGGFLGFYFLNYFCAFSKELEIKQIIAIDNFILDKPRWIDKLVEENPDLLRLNSEDISNLSEETTKLVRQSEYLIHAASIASPSFYRRYPLHTVDANIWGLRGLLDAFAESHTRPEGILFFSSSEIYGDPSESDIPTNEDYRGNVSCLGPRACYDEAKRFGETLCWIYHDQFGLPVTIARPFNNFGPGMSLHDGRLPADLAKQILSTCDIEIFSDGTPTRAYCYVADAIVGYLSCLVHGKFDVFNIGSDSSETSVSEFALIFVEVARDLFGYEKDVVFKVSSDTAYLKDNPQRRCPDLTKARSMLSYDSRTGVKQGVERYLKHLAELRRL